MIILIKTESLTFSLDIINEDICETLYQKVAERCEKKRFQFTLIFAGEVLNCKSTIGSYGIKKECTIHMKLIKEIKIEVSYKEKLYPITIPNNDGLKILHLVKKIQDELGCEVPEVKTSKVSLSKYGNFLADSMVLQDRISNNDVIDMKLKEYTRDAGSSSTTTAAAEVASNDTLVSDDELLNSFVQSAISSDVEVVFCFDTTGSMSAIIQQVRTKVSETVTRLMNTIPNIRIGIMGLGDYCDKEKVLVTLDLTNDVDKIVKFVKDVPNTSGGDCPEAYEYALYKAKSLSWSNHTSKAFVLIGDERPHEPSHTSLHINWFEECDILYDMGIKIYGIKATGTTCFYEEISERTGGLCIDFKRFDLITEMFIGICYREASKEKFQKYQNELKSNGQVNNELNQILDDLSKENYKVVDESSKESIDSVLVNNNNNNSNNNNESDSTSTLTSTSKSKQITKQRGKPSSNKVQESWYNHSIDNLSQPPMYVYNESKGYFILRSDPFNLSASTPSSTSKSYLSYSKSKSKSKCKIM